MKFSRSLKSSNQSLPSPNGSSIATIFPSQLSIRSTQTLEITRVISLPPDLLIQWFQWSLSSNLILLATSDTIRVFSPSNQKFNATIHHPPTTKITHITFGSPDDEVLVFSEYGLKVSIYNLATHKAVDIKAPKFYTANVAGKGYSYRPHTAHLALLTRNSGKDVLSIHFPGTLDVVRSWVSASIDAQGVCWSRDGEWFVVWESASQGHKVFVYTADGHLFKTWNGPTVDENQLLGAGIRGLEMSTNGALVAVGDFSERVTVLGIPSFGECMSLVHPAAVDPRDGLQIWQEQIASCQSTNLTHSFILSTQSISPPPLPTPTTSTESRTGTNLLSFDTSSTLLATRLENMPTTLWIWDIASTHSLRAVLILHSNILKVTWHPTINELLMVVCENDKEKGIVHLWDPSWSSPKVVDFRQQIPGGKILGQGVVRWIEFELPTVFFSDDQDCLLCSITPDDDEEENGEEGKVIWADAEVSAANVGTAVDIYGEREESPLQLVPAKRERKRAEDVMEEGEFGDTLGLGLGMNVSGGSEEVDDTFQFRKFVG